MILVTIMFKNILKSLRNDPVEKCKDIKGSSENNP